MIGNDLVYLPAWPKRSGSRLQRFREKVFTEAERAFIQASEDEYLAEAWLWSCKEAAYKVWFKTSHRREFTPKRFMVQGSRLEVESLKFGLEASLMAFDKKYFLYSIFEENYTHTLASDQSFAEVQNAEIWRGHFRPESLLEGKITLAKDHWGVPYGRRQKDKIDLSKSHDNERVVLAWLT